MARSSPLEELDVLQAVADRPASQERIALRFGGSLLRNLIRAKVQSPYDHRVRGHSLHNLAVGLELLVLGGFGLAGQVEELGAVEAHAFGASLEGAFHLVRKLDVAQQLHPHPVESDGRQLPQVPQVQHEAVELLPADPVVLDGLGIGVGDHHAVSTVDDDHVAIGGAGGDIAEADDGWNPPGPGDDGGMAGPAAQIGGDGKDLVGVFEFGGLGGGQVVGDDDDGVLHPLDALTFLAN